MAEPVKLSRLRDFLATFEYPVTKAEVRDAAGEVQLQYADGVEPLRDVVDRSTERTFDSVDSLEATIFNNLPVGAVGEPGQSEGEG